MTNHELRQYKDLMQGDMDMWESSRVHEKIDLAEKLVESKKIILYGAGFYGKRAWALLADSLKEKVASFAVTEKENESYLCGVAIKQINELVDMKNEALTVICVADDKADAINNTLSALGFDNVMMFDEDALLYASAIVQLKEISKRKIFDRCNLDKYPYDEAVLCERALAVSDFIESIGEKELVFKKLPFVWGGSGILDYALLRGLFLKYKLKNYLEIGTYIGASLAAVDDLTENCFSVTVPPDDPRHMRFWCEARHMKDYSNRLVNPQKVVQFLEDSTYFDYRKIKVPVDLYFVDGDHSYRGVYIDTIKLIDHFDPESSFVVWHDCRTAAGIATEVVKAVYDALGDYWKNFFVFDVGCMCGIYIPPKYQSGFQTADESDELTTYKVTLKLNR